MLKLPRMRYIGTAVGLTACITICCKGDWIFRGKEVITIEELSKHRQMDDCWIGINGKVYDVSEFLTKHPGGSDKILRYAGSDASKGFKLQHPEEYIEKFISKQFVGKLEEVKKERNIVQEVKTSLFDEPVEKFKKPPLSNIFSLDDFKYVENMMYGWRKESSPSKDALCRIFFRPRCLVDVSHIELGLNLWQQRLEHPFVINLKELQNVSVEEINNLKEQKHDRRVVDGIVGECELRYFHQKGFDGVILVEKEGCMTPIEVLQGIKPDPNFVIFVRDGITRGSDVVKILSLGGIPLVDKSLDATEVYGKDGFDKGVAILQKEVETTMKLLGAKDVNKLNPTFLELSSLNRGLNIDYKRYKEENERYTRLKFPEFKSDM